MVLEAITVFIIEREFQKTAIFAFAGSVLTFFGLMHGEAVGIAQTPAVAASYLFVTVFLFGVAKYGNTAPKPAEEPVVHGGAVPAD